MASKSSTPSNARTEPKGRATLARNERVGRRSFLSARMEWALAIIAMLLVFAGIFYFFGDARSTQQGGVDHGVPAGAVGFAPLAV